jgi:2'-5' RNA ligase
MSEIQKIYDGMWLDAIQHIKNDNYEIDNLINSSKDTRRGVTVLSYLSDEIVVAISELSEKLKIIEPEQYYYPTHDFHLTVLSIITCVEGFKLSDIDVKEYSEAFEQALEDIGPLKIHYSGVTASSSCILVQGFPDNDHLTILRDKLRLSFKKFSLYTTIDLRYEISTAHATIVRFQSPLRDSEAFIQLLAKYRNIYFGTLEVNRLDFVFNNWYQNLLVTKQLSSRKLNPIKNT